MTSLVEITLRKDTSWRAVYVYRRFSGGQEHAVCLDLEQVVSFMFNADVPSSSQRIFRTSEIQGLHGPRQFLKALQSRRELNYPGDEDFINYFIK